jgi:hypothetical protein
MVELALRHLLHEFLKLGRAFGVGSCISQALVDAGTLAVDDVLEALFDVLHEGVEAVAVELLLAAAAELLHEVAQALEAVAVGAHAASLEEVLHGPAEVAIVQEVVRQEVEEFIGLQRVDLL